MRVCSACGIENAETARFCSQCGTALEASAAPRREERKVVTVVFADMVGSTERAERLDPEDVRALLAPYHARLRHGLTQAGRFLAIRLLIPDRPGQLRDVLDLIAQGRGNVVSVDHHREGRTTSALQTEIELVVSTRDEAHCQELLGSLRADGRLVERIGPPS